MLKFVYKSKNAVVVYKPENIPSAPDKTGTPDLMSLCKKALIEMGESGELYLVHRLDTVVAGLLVFARNKESSRQLSALVADGMVNKEYFAVTCGTATEGTLADYLCKNPKINKAFVSNSSQNGAKYAELSYKTLGISSTEKGERSLVKIKLKTGRFHQIRAQFSSRGLPLVGDTKYGSRDFGRRTPALFAYRLDFELMGEHIMAEELPDLTAYPWNLFQCENYKG